jgi:two-component system response regulator AtoC
MSEKPFTVFVVEDNEWYNKLLVHNLSLNPDFEVKSFLTAKELLQNLGANPDAVTLDYRLPDMNGKDVLSRIKQQCPETEVVVISEQENIETAVELLKIGAYDYLVKGDDIRDRLLNTMNNIRKHSNLRSRIVTLEKEVQKKYQLQNTIVGQSPVMEKVLTMVEKAISTNITVTITGETGTGKEVIAKAIHYNSTRRDKPFVAVNVAAIPGELIESELFGYEKGSFTGAAARRIGKFEEANGGTLFLDEIGEMSLPFQAKMLRALQEKEITRIGSNAPVKVDSRIIVATHRNLKEEVKNNRFREDLYYRLFGLPVELPPLRDRGNDILILARHFINLFCKENGMPPKTLSEDAQRKLMSYAFPGNVRELKSVVELAVVMSNTDDIRAGDITLTTFDALPDVMAEELTLREYELRIVNTYLKKYNDNIKLVAEKLDIGQSTIYRMLKEEGKQ